ncbi:MAG: lanthionine synthetase LanC family protein [Chloroflexota bacterium]
MATNQVSREIAKTAREGADSVFAYIERTAEATPDGVRWQTLSYQDTPQYSSTGFDGVAGISLFLAAYYRLTGNAGARDLAAGGLEWCTSPERASEPWWQYVDNESLGGGRAGVGLAWLRFAAATGDQAHLGRAVAIGQQVAGVEPGAPTAWGPPATDYLYGAAGTGIFLVRLWESSRDERFLAAALRYGTWLASHVVRDDRGSYWGVRVDASPAQGRLGFCHGTPGIGYFLLLLAQASPEGRWAALVREVAATLTRHAIPDRGGLNWPDRLDEREVTRCQWCIGAPGVGVFWTKAHEVLGDPSFLEMGVAAGHTTFAYGDVRHNGGQCHGLAGSAELFIELFRRTRDPLWLDRAHDFAIRALAYRVDTPHGDAWQTDEPGCTSPDFAYGAAGAGHFFLRLLAPDQVRLALG